MAVSGAVSQAKPPLSQQEGEMMPEAMLSRLIIPQCVFQGSKTVDWIRKPWAYRSPGREDRMQAKASSSAADAAQAKHQRNSTGKLQLTEEDALAD